MKKILFSLLLITTIAACGIKADHCDDSECGHSVTIKHEIVMHQIFQSTVSSEGMAKYLWYSPQGRACTAKEAMIRLDLVLKERNKIVPTFVNMWVITGGQIDELQLIPESSSTSTQYNEYMDFNLFNATDACHASVQLRLQIEFENFGSSELNDTYLKDLIDFDGGVMSIEFRQGMD